MLEQTKEEWQVLALHALLVERQNEAAALGLQKKVRVLDAFGNPLEPTRFAKLERPQKFRELVVANFSVNGHPR